MSVIFCCCTMICNAKPHTHTCICIHKHWYTYSNQLSLPNLPSTSTSTWTLHWTSTSMWLKEGDTQIGTDGRTIYDHSALATLGSSNPETQRMVNLAKQAEDRSREVRYWTLLYCIVLHSILMRCIVQYCTALYCIALCDSPQLTVLYSMIYWLIDFYLYHFNSTQRLGYDVFKPHMSSSSSVGRSSSSSDIPSTSASQSASSNGSPRAGRGGAGSGGDIGRVGKGGTDPLSGRTGQQDR